MNLYALDKNGALTFAHSADKQNDYFCLECRSVVRCRGGLLRQLHFYHLDPHRTCRQNGKSLEHLQVQLYLQKRLPGSELEKRFPDISRIADVFWPEKNLVIEIQCSPMTAREMDERQRDYQKMNCQVIWVLHDQQFNRYRLTAAEYFLQEWPHYFTNMKADGQGVIYDQWDKIELGRRKTSLGYCEVDVSSYRSSNLLDVKEYPYWIHKRIKSWRWGFSGDFLDRLSLMDESQKQEFFSKVVQDSPKDFQPVKKILDILLFPYRLWVKLMLEKLTR